jgi:tetratricopeptide (TPR) repeat protein
MQTYTLAEVASLLALPRAVIAGLIAAGFVTPERGTRREYRFTFQDLVLLRAAQGLKEAQMAPGRIQRSLKALRAQLPEQMPVAGLRLAAVGNDIVVRERGSAAWQNAAGQWLLDLEGGGAAAAGGGGVTSEPARHAADEAVHRLRGSAAAGPLPQGAAAASAGQRQAPPSTKAPSPRARARATAEQWLQRAVELETTDRAQAEAAYRHAIAADPQRADAYLNLGALLGDAGRHAEAAAVARLGIERCAPEPLLHFNLGVALEDARQPAAAIEAYQQSLALNDALADAHFNLARLHDRLGDKKQAIRHYSAYRRLQAAGAGR